MITPPPAERVSDEMIAELLRDERTHPTVESLAREVQHRRAAPPASEKLRAAAERCRKRRAGIRIESDDDYHNPTMSVLDDAMLADAYLASAPPPTTADVLPELNDEERKAMNSLPTDFVDHLLKGERASFNKDGTFREWRSASGTRVDTTTADADAG